MSSQLTDSYSMLEARVTELKGELAVVSAQRMQELAEKERLANRLQNLLDLLPGGVIVIDDQGLVREANPAACELLGLPLRASCGARSSPVALRPVKTTAMKSPSKTVGACRSPPARWMPSPASWCCSTT
jgi:PAS domain-containing protein